MISQFWKWAYDHSDNTHNKYSQYQHSLYVTISGTILFVMISLFGSQAIIDKYPQPQLHQHAMYVGFFIVLYLFFMIYSRTVQNGTVAIYQFLWACNLCLLVSAIAIFNQNAQLIRVVLVTISVDQLLWYIDLIGYILKRKFIVGVAKYIIWPQTSKMRLLTTFHHLWFIPLAFWLVSPSFSWCSFDLQVFLCSGLQVIMLASIGRWSAPKEVVSFRKGQKRSMYLNLNISWQLWKDVKIGLMETIYKVVPPAAMPLVLALFWIVANIVGFTALALIEWIFR